MKIRPVEAELFHEDRRTDMKKLIVALLNLANAPKRSGEKNTMRSCIVHVNYR